MYVKLFTDILTSSLWQMNPTARCVWIALLCMADRTGVIRATEAAIARMSNVRLSDTRSALAAFAEPDPQSRSDVSDGRRIERFPWGCRLINYEHYDKLRDEDARREYMRKYMADRRLQERKQEPLASEFTVSNVSHPSVDVDASVDVDVASESITHLPSTSVSDSVTDGANDNGGEIDFQKGTTATAPNDWQEPGSNGVPFQRTKPPKSERPTADPLALHPDWDEDLLFDRMCRSPEGRKIGLDKASEFEINQILGHPPRIAFATILDIARADKPPRKPLSVLTHRLKRIAAGDRKFMPSDEHLDEAVKRLAKRSPT